MLHWLKKLIMFSLFPVPHVAGVFDSIDGTYDEQTSFGFGPTLFVEARERTILGPLSKGRDDVSDMIAGGEPLSVDNTACIVRKEIKKGDMVRFTREEAIKGMPTWGDSDVQRGNFVKYKNLESRVNQIKSPAIPLPGEMSLQRAAESLKNPKGRLRRQVVDYMAQEMEYEFLIALHYGASKAALRSEDDGGLGVNLGVGSGVGAGTPLMGKNFYCKDQGFPTYTDVHATWNSNLNTYMASITAGADAVTLLIIKTIRRQLDKIHFAPAYIDGKKYKAIALCDPDIWYHLDHLLHDDYELGKPRAQDHEIFGVDHQLVYHGILFLNVPNMEIFRPGYQASPAYPTLGPGLTVDPRDYAVTSSIGGIMFIGGGAVFEGYNGNVKTTEHKGYHGDGYEIGARTKDVFVRGEWYAKDGRASAAANTYCNSVLYAAFYEAGVGSLT